jgi:hypothetical protein
MPPFPLGISEDLLNGCEPLHTWPRPPGSSSVLVTMKKTAIFSMNRLKLWPTHLVRQTVTQRSTPTDEEGGW